MSAPNEQQAGFNRRQLFRYAGAAAVVAAGTGSGMKWLKPFASSAVSAEPRLAQVTTDHYMFLGGTDGWMGLPPTPAIGYFHPDNLAPPDLTTYIFGFRNITELSQSQQAQQKQRAQHSAPLFWVNQFDGTPDNEFVVDITNLGLAVRPDLFDAHTLHWHGFRNVIPFFDGEPTGSVSVPAGTVFRYVYRPHEEGTYMWHCHVEDVEHVHMGMNGMVFVRPLQNGNTSLYPSGKYLYNDGDGSTAYDREYSFHLSEVWAESHWADAHIQLPEWSDYRADFAMLNGRVYPDTVAPNAPFPLGWGEGAGGTVVDGSGQPWTKPYMPVRVQATGDLAVAPGFEHLRYQPLSSLVRCEGGERVALRFSNLGFKEAAMTIDGIPMHVVGRDATLMRGRTDGAHPSGTDTSYLTNTINFNAGESMDVIITAPAFTGGSGSSGQGYDLYMLYNRNYLRSNNLAPGGFGGQATEIRVYPSGSLPDQTVPNT
jgi:FtsP/CotA-like multicopper oxidase with cupredoxin domain